MRLLPAVVGCEEELGRGNQSRLVNCRRPTNKPNRPDQAKLVICDQPIDITYIRLRDEFAYLAVVMDVFTRSIRGWHLGRDLDQGLTLAALERALVVAVP